MTVEQAVQKRAPRPGPPRRPTGPPKPPPPKPRPPKPPPKRTARYAGEIEALNKGRQP